MTDKEIIKALEYCKNCSANLNIEIIDLITHQQAEYNNLLEQFRILDCECGRLEKADENQKAEIERLKKILAEEEEKYKLCAKRFYKVGVKDFAEKLKSTYFIDSERLCCQVDKVFKEMVGDTE